MLSEPTKIVLVLGRLRGIVRNTFFESLFQNLIIEGAVFILDLLQKPGRKHPKEIQFEATNVPFIVLCQPTLHEKDHLMFFSPAKWILIKLIEGEEEYIMQVLLKLLLELLLELL